MKNKTGIILSIVVFFFGAILPIFFFHLNNVFVYFIKPFSWLVLLLIVFLFSKKANKPYNFNKRYIMEYTIIAALIYIIIYFSLGLVVGYNNSSFDRSLMGIAKNLWAIIPFLISRELIRDRLIKTSPKGYNLVPILITIFLVFTNIPYSTFVSNSKTLIDIIEFLVKTLMPSIFINVFLSYLCIKESYKSSLLYILPLRIITYLTPIFPVQIFFITIIIDLLIPLFTFMKIDNLFNRINLNKVYEEKTVFYYIRRYLTLSILLFLVMFSIRVLPISPIVILSNSMLPYIEKGDLVIIKKTGLHDIKINDIIEYKVGGVHIVHRVINIKEANKGHIYITKGDNNDAVDRPVYDEQIVGKVVGYIPKLGYPTIWIREFLEKARGIKV